MSIIKPKKHTKRNESHFAIFASFVGKLKFLASNVSPSSEHKSANFWFDIRYVMR